MNINATNIERLGGLTILEIEPNAPDIPQVDGIEITAYLFDGFGVAQHEGIYLFLMYPGLGNAKTDMQTRRTVNQYRYGNRLPDNFKLTVDDLAMCFATFEEIDHREYVNQLMKGMITYSPTRLLPRRLASDRLREQNLRIIMNPPKHLYIFKDEQEFLKELGGKVYGAYLSNGDYLCDLLEDDILQLESDGKMINPTEFDSLDDLRIEDTSHSDYIYSQRVEIIILNPKTKAKR